MTAPLRDRLLRRISRLNRGYPLLEPRDRVLVACSGGKDSWAMLHLLRHYERKLPFHFDIIAVTIDQGHPGFDAQRLRDHFEAHSFEHRIVSEDTYSVVVEQTPPGKIHCSLCSRMRRGILHKVAAALDANKIALGHHRDDAIETLLLNMMYAGEIKSMVPFLAPQASSPHSPGVGAAVIRPLLTCAESDLADYAAAIEAPILPCNLCGTQPDSRRQAIKGVLNGLETTHPHVRDQLLAAMGHVRTESLFRVDGQQTPPEKTARLPIAPFLPTPRVSKTDATHDKAR